MKEIKFRGKRLDTGEWSYGFVLETKMSGLFIIGSSMERKNTRNGTVLYDKLWQFEINPSTVGQYTGLKDKNGKEIFEGDVIHKYGKYEVVFDGYRFIGKGYYNTCYDIPDDIFSEELDRVEVIGNIHDNPELLKVCPDFTPETEE